MEDRCGGDRLPVTTLVCRSDVVGLMLRYELLIALTADVVAVVR